MRKDMSQMIVCCLFATHDATDVPSLVDVEQGERWMAAVEVVKQ